MLLCLNLAIFITALNKTCSVAGAFSWLTTCYKNTCSVLPLCFTPCCNKATTTTLPPHVHSSLYLPLNCEELASFFDNKFNFNESQHCF